MPHARPRVAALYVSERMRNEVVATVAAHYQQLALAAARRAAARALCRSRSARHQVPTLISLQAASASWQNL